MKSTDAGWLLLFLGYFGVQAAIRAGFGTSLNWDEAEALYFARRLDWGYGPQPPLYFWLQWGFFQVFGPTVLALTLFKNLLLAGFVVLVFGLLRREVGVREAGVATLSLGLVVALAWEGQRALTHSATALVCAAAAAWLALRALEKGRWRDHLALGAVAGLGVLSKLNFLIWAAALLLAAILMPEWRSRLRPVRVLGAAALALLMNLPALAWMAWNPDLALSSLNKLEVAEGGGFGARLAGTGSLAGTVLTFLALPILVLGGFWLAARRRPGGGWHLAALPPGIRLVGMAALLSIGLLWVGVLTSGSTHIDYMWLLPLAWPLVPVAVLALWPRLSDRARKGLAGMAGAAWILALAGLPIAASVGSTSGNRWLDYGPLAARLEELEEAGLPILLRNVPLAGNLVLREPGLEPSLLTAAGPGLPATRSVLVVRVDDPLLASAEVERRTESVEYFDPLRESGPRRVAVVLLGEG